MKRKKVVVTASAQEYAKAHEAHYKEKDLREAVRLYDALIVAHPDSPEAKYSRSQVQNIANNVVPEEARLVSLLGLISSSLESQESSQSLVKSTKRGGA